MRCAIVSLAVLLGVGATGCDEEEHTPRVEPGNSTVGNGLSKTETREVAAFDEVQLHGAYRVEIAIGPSRPIEITADDNLLPVIRTEVKDNRLIVRPSEPITPKTEILLRIGAPNVEGLFCYGFSKIRLRGVNNETLRIGVTGATVAAHGETNSLNLSVEGDGEIRADELRAHNVDATLTGGGKVDTLAIDKLIVFINGTGTVRYSGNPEIEKRIIGPGSLQRR